MPTPRLRRLASPKDFAEVHRIYTHDEVAPFLGFDPVPLTDFRPVFEDLLATNSFFVALRDGHVRGFYRVNRQKGRSRHVVVLETLAIDPVDEKGSGFAHAMIGEALECMRHGRSPARRADGGGGQSARVGVLSEARVRAGRTATRGVQARESDRLRRRTVRWRVCSRRRAQPPSTGSRRPRRPASRPRASA